MKGLEFPGHESRQEENLVSRDSGSWSCTFTDLRGLVGGVCEDSSGGWGPVGFHTSAFCLHSKYMGKSFSSTHIEIYSHFLETYGVLRLTCEFFFRSFGN